MKKFSLSSKLMRAAEFVESTIDAEKGLVNLVWSTGASVQRYNWEDGEVYNEVLAIRKDAVDLSRFENGAPFLKDHTRSIDSVLGCIERAWIDEAKNEAWATVRFDLTEGGEGEKYFAKVKSRILRSTSVGYRIIKLKDVSEKNAKVRTLEASRWLPFEISLVAVPADANSTIRTDDRDVIAVEFETIQLRNEEPTMPEPTPVTTEGTQPQTVPTPAATPPAIDSSRELQALEQKRIFAAQEAGRALGMTDAVVRQILSETQTLEQVKIRLLDEYSHGGSKFQQVGAVRAGNLDETETRRLGAEEYLLHRSFPEKFKLAERGREYYGMSLQEIARDCLEAAGTRSRGMNKFTFFERAMTTSDYPLLLSNLSNKILLNFYELAERTYTPFVTEKEVSDFKPINPLRVSEIGELKELAEDAEIETTYLKEHGDSYRIKTFARMLHFSLQQMINDDLGAFTKALSTFGVAAAMTEQNRIYEVIVNNLLMGDGLPIFEDSNKEGSHRNVVDLPKDRKLLGDTDQISDGFTKMMEQKSLGDNYLTLSPKYLLVPHTLREAALKMVSTNFLATQFTNQNIYGGQFIPIIEPRLINSLKKAKDKENAYYMLAGKEKIDFIEYAYLSGAKGIQTEPQQTFEKLGFRVRGVLHFGVKALEHRGVVKIRQAA